MGHRFLFIFILALGFGLNGFGQPYSKKEDAAINNCIHQLQQKGIDTICVYTTYCVGGSISFTRPGEDTTCKRQPFINNTYILWKRNGITNMTVKTYCFDYDTIKVGAGGLWIPYTKINKKEIRPFQVVATRNGKKEIETVVIDHSCHQDIILIIDKKRLVIELDDFDFEKMTEGGRRETNINYTYNWNTRTKRLQVLLDELVHINFGKLKKLK